MNVTITHEGPITIVDADGVVKLGETAAEFSRWLEKVLREDKGPVIINFERITYMDSTGLGELVGYLQKFDDQQRAMALVNPSHRIASLMELTKLDSLFPVFRNVEEAALYLSK